MQVFVLVINDIDLVDCCYYLSREKALEAAIRSGLSEENILEMTEVE